MRIELTIPDAIEHSLLDHVQVPPLARVRYAVQTPPALVDIRAAVAEQLRCIGASSSIQAGNRIALAVGSRGIGRLPDIVEAVVAGLRVLGADVFIVPAMGSHGGATPQGQFDVLRHLGVTEDRVGAPILSSMDTVEIGRTPQGAPVYLDKLAHEADAVVFVARVKAHTAFRGPYESGLAKMLAIGLGKQKGAATTHARGFGEMGRMIPEMARVVLARAHVPFGIAVLENAHDEPWRVVAVPAARILEDEPALLDEAKRSMARLPFHRFDVLVIDRIGKNISGDGADPNVTGRYPTPFASGGPEVNKQVVLDLSAATGGNANGLGTADFTTARVARKMDLAQTYPNALTSTVSRPVALPMILASDRLAMQAALLTSNAVDRPATLVRISDTLHLQHFWISASMLPLVRDLDGLEIVEPPSPPEFDSEGNLCDLDEHGPPAPVGTSANDSW